MSQIKLAPNASGTGIFTIDSPNSNTNRTLTLPDATGTILTSATTTGFPAGVISIASFGIVFPFLIVCNRKLLQFLTYLLHRLL